LNLLFAGWWIVVYAWISFHSPLAGLVCIVLPMVAVLFIAACQTYIDHGGTSDELFGNAWSRTSPLMTAAYFGANYHLEHHAYPGVPCYRLPRVHQILKENGTYDHIKPPITRGFFESFRNLAAPYEPLDIGGDFNAFDMTGKGEHEPDESASDTAKRS